MESVPNLELSFQEQNFGPGCFDMTVQLMIQLIFALKFEIQLFRAGCQTHQKKKDQEQSHH
jgi:hypothetical protein